MAEIFAKIDQNGNIVYRSNNANQMTSSRLSTGHYRVDFGPGFAPGDGPPVVVATVMTEKMDCAQDGANCSISIIDVTNEYVCFATLAASDCNTSVDCPFNFAAFGPTTTRS